MVRFISKHWLGLLFLLALLAGVVLRTIYLATVPLGYFHDEAWSGAKAWALLTGAAPPEVYFAENNGMDALHVYLIAFVYLLTGPLAAGSRIASTLAGSLTLLATSWAAAELFAREQRRFMLVLISTFVYATLFSALAVSRSGWHAMSMTLFTTLCVAALLRGRRVRQRRWFVVAGVLAGIAQYTYPSARFIAVWLIIIALWDGWRQRQDWRTVTSRYALLFGAAVFVVVPLGIYFVQHPEWLFVRSQQTTKGLDLWQNLLKTLAGFAINGSPDNLHNLPGRPVLDPILSVFAIIGLVGGIARRKSACLLLLFTLGVFTLPPLLTEGAPLTRRWAGAMPFVSMLAALGVVLIYDQLRPRLHHPIGRSILVGSLTVLLLSSAGLSAADYFGPYAANPQLFWAYDAGITQVANYIRSRPDATIFLSPYDRFYEVVDLTLAEAGHAPIQSYNGLACALFPRVTERETAWVVITEKDRSTLPFLRQVFPLNEVVWRLNSPVGSYARVLRVPAAQSAQLTLSRTASADFGGRVRLSGFELPAAARPGENVPVTIALEDIAPLDRLYKVFLHLRGSDGAVIAQDDHAPCANSLNEADWRPGNIVVEPYQLSLPTEVPPGDYEVRLGLYDPTSGVRLPVTTASVAHDADSIQLGTIHVRPATSTGP
jgi:4-amino-4-deoxy-L-arabinose transferase-like glycosyltransferase